jgi:hypothetical protein
LSSKSTSPQKTENQIKSNQTKSNQINHEPSIAERSFCPAEQSLVTGRFAHCRKVGRCGLMLALHSEPPVHQLVSTTKANLIKHQTTENGTLPALSQRQLSSTPSFCTSIARPLLSIASAIILACLSMNPTQ